MSSRINTLRLIRSRGTGFALIGVFGFLIAGFVFGSPVIEAIPNIAPPETVSESQLQLPFEETFVNDTSIVIDDVPIPDDPVSSDDSPLEQIVDEVVDTPADIILPDVGSNKITLMSEVTKIDSQGNSTVITGAFDVLALAFFVEEETDVDFEQGRLEIRLWAISSEPELRVDGTGLFDILINNQTIFTVPIPIIVGGISGESGATFNFISETGIESQVFIFSFADHVDKFVNEAVTPLEIKVTSLDLTLDNRDKFGSTELTIFTMDIARDPNRILILNEQGGFDKIFPTDDILNVKAVRYANRLQPHIDLIQLKDSTGNPIFTSTAGCPITQLDRNNILSCTDSNDGGVKLVNFELQRDSTYTLRVKGETSQNRGAFDFTSTWDTPKSQKNYSFICQWYQGGDPPFRGAQNDCHLLNCQPIQTTTVVRGVTVPFSTCDTIGAGN